MSAADIYSKKIYFFIDCSLIWGVTTLNEGSSIGLPSKIELELNNSNNLKGSISMFCVFFRYFYLIYVILKFKSLIYVLLK